MSGSSSNPAIFSRAFATAMMREAIAHLTLVEVNDEDIGDISEPLGAAAKNVTEDGISESAPRKRLKIDDGSVKFATDSGTYAQKTITDIPLEIFHAIALHLTPPDLLALTRSTKFLRGIFMSRSSRYIWISAIANVHKLPPCPVRLAEPQYISLIYSKTCSECGSRTHRQMDACLRVRLCARCCNLLIRGIDLTQPILILLPYELYLQPGNLTVSYILKRDLDEIGDILEDPRFEDDKASSDWKVTRLQEMEARFTHADEVDGFLQDMERERIQKQKEQRKLDIESRLFEDGWTVSDMAFPWEDTQQWKKLVLQPEPVTDQSWLILRPKLVTLLKNNRERKQESERRSKAMDRRIRLGRLFSDLREERLPLAEVVVHWNEGPKTIRIEAPFPPASEVLAWSSVKEMVESDAGVDQVEQAFQEHRGEILQLVEGWKLKVETDLREIWNKAPIPNTEETSEAKLKPQRRIGTRRSPRKPKPKDELDVMCGSVLPECTVTFFNKDGSSVSSVESLSDHTSILLRATTTFHAIPNLLHRYYYPELLPSPRSFLIPLEDERPCLIDIWDPSTIVRDDDVSNTARMLLERMRRPNATYPELKAMGDVFVCQRPGCRLAPPMGWERYVGHYPFEQSRWKEAQTKLKETSSRFVYNNTHDLSEDNPEPLVKILNPTDAAKLEFERLDPSPGIDVSLDEYKLMLCKICEQVGFEVWLMHTYIPSERSNLMEHLAPVAVKSVIISREMGQTIPIISREISVSCYFKFFSGSIGWWPFTFNPQTQ